MDVGITSFLPAYPTLDLRNDNLFQLFPQGFTQSILNKKEFFQLSSIPDAPRIEDGKFHPQPHQTFNMRYNAPETLYDKQMVIHTMGTGKTALAILTAENAIGRGFVGAVIAVPSQKFFRNFMSEIVKITGTKYFPEKHRDLSSEELERAIRKNIRKVYRFLTFEAFANSLTKDDNLQDAALAARLKEEYSNRVIIIDEAHNLRIKPDKRETSEVYKAFHVFLHSVSNCKILIMTATPMKDRWNELADLSNLLLDQDKQLPTGGEFDRQFSNDGEKISNVEVLKSRLQGIVTTLRAVPSSVKREYVGETVGDLTVFKVDLSQMSEFQEKAYLAAYQKDTSSGSKEGIYDASRQAVNFVFPDGSYGSEGFKRFMIPIKKAMVPSVAGGKVARAARGTRTFPIEEMGPELLKAIRGATQEETLQNIHKYSCKYAQTIRYLLNQTERKGGNSYIYNWYVEGSGCIVFARLLELFGYSRSVNGLETTKGKRYVLLTNKTLDEQGRIVSNVQKTVNDPKNARGEYIQVIIGSQTSGEGLSFYNVEEIVVHTPFFNYSPTDQAIARGIRYGSHDEIIRIYQEEKKEFRVRIHHCVAAPSDLKASIDYQMYNISQEKDRRIKLGERMLKEISYDCGSNRLVNMRGMDGSRECEYLTCEYKCEGINDLENKSPDYSSFNFYYSQEEEKEIARQIKQFFQREVILTLTELFSRLSSYQPFIILKTLKRLIDQSDPIYNRFGFKTYLREHNDTYFLVDSMEKPSSSLTAWYTAFPAIREVKSLAGSIETAQFLRAGDLLDRLLREPNRTALVARLPLSVREALLEACIDAEEAGSTINTDFRRWYLDYYRSSVVRLADGRYVSTLVEGVISCRFGPEDWRDCTDDETITNELEKKKLAEVKDLENNPYGYYAIVNTSLLQGPDGWKHGFWIRDVEKAKQKEGPDRRKKIRGEKCSIGSLKVGKLASIAYSLGMDFPNNADHKMTPAMIISMFDKDGFITVNYKSLPEPELRRLFRLFKGRGRGLCEGLLKFFQEKGLVQLTDAVSMK